MLDELDRSIVAALQIEPRATWRAIGSRVGVSAATAARRGRRLFEAGIVRVVGSPVSARLGFGFHVLIGFRCRPGEALDVARRLSERPDVRYVTVATGTFDVIAEFLVPSKRHLAFVLIEELPQIAGIIGTDTSVVLRTYKVRETISYTLSGDVPLEDMPADPHWPEVGALQADSRELDALDLRLIQLVSEDGRRSNAELAIALSLSESAVSRRLAALVREGYVVFATLVDAGALGFDVEALIWIGARARQLEEVAKYIAAEPHVRYVSATSGYSDLVCEVVLRSHDDLFRFTTDVLGGHKGIERVSISRTLLTLKRGYLIYADRLVGESQRRLTYQLPTSRY
jgi:DNA-binding Lrp family transcriptional regulator